MACLRIYRNSTSAMQSGDAGTDVWTAEFEPEERAATEPLMGWTTMRDTRRQLRLRFASREAALTWAQARGVPFVLVEPQARQVRPRAYADNFAHNRLQSWTH